MSDRRKLRKSLAALAALAVCGVLASSCSLERRLSKSFLQPTTDQIATPADLDLPFEDVFLAVDDDVTLHGWFLPSADAFGRTVVLCHGSSANISYLHPYYRFLHEAGFNVFVFDYRGYGRSTGEASVGALLDDLAIVDDTLRQRRDVQQVAYYGISLGSILALRAGATGGEQLVGVVVENTISAGLVLEKQAGSLFAWYLETFVLPGGIEVIESAANVRCPVLLLEGQYEGTTGIAGHLATYAELPEQQRAMWMMPETGHAPHALLTLDGHYQTAIVEFLRGCFGDGPSRLVVNAEPGEGNRVRVSRVGTNDTSRWAVQLCLLFESGEMRFQKVWLDDAEQVFELGEAKPMLVSATRYRDVIEGHPWSPRTTELMRAGEIWDSVQHLALALQQNPGDTAIANEIASRLQQHEQRGAFHPLLEARLTATYGTMGESLWSSDRAGARYWLARCVASRPDKPQLCYWPGRPYVAGFPAQDFVDAAAKKLATND